MSKKKPQQENSAASEEAEAPEKEKTAKKPKKEKPAVFRQEDTPEQRLSRRDRMRVFIGLIVTVLLILAAVALWVFRGALFGDESLNIFSRGAPRADAEYLFDTSSGQCFASVGEGFAVATASSFELLDENGQVAASRLVQMETPAIAACSQYAVFYDIGGLNIAAAFFDGSVRELTPGGTIISAVVSANGYLALTTESPGYRGLVTVYDPKLEPIYEWYSSSAWVISAEVSPDDRSLAVLSYTTSGSEVRLFSLSSDVQKAAFTVNKLLLDAHWFSSTQLCAFSADQAFFFDNAGLWTNTYDFEGRFLNGTAFGDGFVVFALSKYRAASTCTLVSCSANGRELGTAELQGELLSLVASGTEALALCPDSAMLFSSSMSSRGTLRGLTGFKYGLLRSRGEALLIASGYAEVHSF